MAPISIGELLFQDSKVGSPIRDFNVFLNQPNIAIQFNSTKQGYSAGFLTFKALQSIGEVIILEETAALGRTQLFQVPSDQPYNLLISVPGWLPDLNIKIWEVLQMPIIGGGSPTNINIKRLETSASTEGKVTITDAGVLIIAANNNRTALYVTNLGGEWVCVNHKTPVVFGQGIMLQPNGGTYMIESENLDKRLLHGICATGKTTEVSFYEGSGEETAQS